MKNRKAEFTNMVKAIPAEQIFSNGDAAVAAAARRPINDHTSLMLHSTLTTETLREVPPVKSLLEKILWEQPRNKCITLESLGLM